LFFDKIKQKKKKGCCFGFCDLAYFFLSINRAKTIATTMIRTNRPAIAGTKYASAVDSGGADVGAGVAAAAPIAKLDSACDGQYACAPANDARTVYIPGPAAVIAGVTSKA
jgi:hypothetical protein